MIGGAALIVLGGRILFGRRQNPSEAPATTGSGLAWAYVSTLGLTITNPATVISFAALATTLGLGAGAGAGFAKPGVLIGSACSSGRRRGGVCWLLSHRRCAAA